MRLRLLVLGSAIPLAVIVCLASLIGVMRLLPWNWREALQDGFLTHGNRPAALGDGLPASHLLLCNPMGIALDRQGELLVSDRGRDRRGRVVWRIGRDGIAHIFAGSGNRGRARENGALALNFETPEGLAVGEDGSVYVVDAGNHSVLRIRTDGRAERFAGTGFAGFSGDGGPASEAQLYRPADIRLDEHGNLYIADAYNHCVRKVDPQGRITTVSGTGQPGFSPDGTQAALAHLHLPWGLGLDLEGRLLIGDGGNHRVRRVDADGRLVTIAGNGSQGYSGDGGPALEASLNFPEALFVDATGRLFIGDEWNNAVRVVDANGIISTVIGTGFPGRSWIGGVARSSPVDDPENIVSTPEGLIITDGNNGRVIRVSPGGIIELVAGHGDMRPCDYW
jgi:DNA-binding beta-propeller fold protein YncE